MSLEPLHITGGTKFAAGLAGILTTTSMVAGWGVAAFAFLPTGPSEPLTSKLVFLTLALITSAAFIVVSQLLARAALGRFRTGGSLIRFFGYQLGALGVGGGLGLGFLPAMLGAAPHWWVISISAGLGLVAVSLLAFRSDRRRPVITPANPGIGLTEGVVVDYWSGAMPRSAAPSLAVIRYADESGRARFARHLIRQSPTTFGTIGQVQYERRRPDRIRSFTNGRPPAAGHPPHLHFGEYF
ncbi:hypothetical protein D3I60_17995 [Brevibacterium permense]|uniref:hypothetical protein n=1 Tax=Brevibacterium permense TaxID=234834 RepID=UPI0021CEFD99|nr:hypothetical protein [Brevibacterium permense]MCU4298942.1 hypothetical protein [Brevibacterium permense]